MIEIFDARAYRSWNEILQVEWSQLIVIEPALV